MVGIPDVLATRQDWLNAYNYALASQDPQVRRTLRKRLTALTQTRYVKQLKAGVDPDQENLNPDDFEDVLDPASPFARSGLTENEVSQMLGALA